MTQRLTATGPREVQVSCRRCQARCTFLVHFRPCANCGSSHPAAGHAITKAMERWRNSHAEPLTLVTVFHDELVEE